MVNALFLDAVGAGSFAILSSNLLEMASWEAAYRDFSIGYIALKVARFVVPVLVFGNFLFSSTAYAQPFIALAGLIVGGFAAKIASTALAVFGVYCLIPSFHLAFMHQVVCANGK